MAKHYIMPIQADKEEMRWDEVYADGMQAIEEWYANTRFFS